MDNSSSSSILGREYIASRFAELERSVKQQSARSRDSPRSRVVVSPYLQRRVWFITFYPDSSPLLCDRLVSDFRCVGILHDKDQYDNDAPATDEYVGHNKGDVKKAHYHFIVHFPQPKYLMTVASMFEIAQSQVEPINDIVHTHLYLLHAKETSPYQHKYSPDELLGSFDCIKYVNDLFGDVHFADIALRAIIDYIVTRPNGNLYNLTMYCIDNGYRSVFNSHYRIIKDFISKYWFE